MGAFLQDTICLPKIFKFIKIFKNMDFKALLAVVHAVFLWSESRQSSQSSAQDLVIANIAGTWTMSGAAGLSALTRGD